MTIQETQTLCCHSTLSTALMEHYGNTTQLMEQTSYQGSHFTSVKRFSFVYLFTNQNNLSLVDPESPVIFARSFLLEESTNTMFACKTEVKKSESHCRGSNDGGETWKDLHQNVLIVLAYNPIDNVYYVEINRHSELVKVTFRVLALRLNPPRTGKKDCEPYTAQKVQGKPYYCNTCLCANDMSSSQGLLFKPSGAIVWKLVYSWIDYPYDIDECASNPCINGATCVDQVNRFNCTCPPGFTGTLCGIELAGYHSHLGNYRLCKLQSDWDINKITDSCYSCLTDLDECESNPCSNGGVCVNGVNKFTCNCIPGFTGLQCETNIDDCVSNACVNGDCVDGVNQYTCSCYSGNAGVHCEFDLSCVTSNPCLNGGTCIPLSGGGYTCSCTFFYSGSNCQLGSFFCLRLPTFSFDPPYSPNTGKFDKIAFSLSANHKLLGIAVGSTAQQGIPVTLTIKVSNISGVAIASKTTQHTFRHGIPDYPVYFDQPILLTAGQQYIAASLVEAEANMSELARSFDGSAIRFCNPHLTVTFSNVPAEEMADSNGSTVQEGQIIFLYFKPP
ncbi:uncharacterized protein LOC110065552 [Orbicella faveolata]|uniref:uncharacterized protein LOC110065552 n=1 Tax=Orbicella faveolata TaxID=48498 RepID=UPI0009E38E11|nr:uncharacterized protein LOC110065552 [Orbicella faveolata]